MTPKKTAVKGNGPHTLAAVEFSLVLVGFMNVTETHYIPPFYFGVGGFLRADANTVLCQADQETNFLYGMRQNE